MHRKRLAVALAATLALSTVAAACGDDNSGDNADKTTTTAAKGETTTTAVKATPADQNGGRKTASGPLKIGAILPQTGKLASIGPPMIQGAAMAIRDINAAGGVNGADVTLIQKDDGGGTTNDIAKQSVDVLINNDKVNAILGPAGSGTTKEVEDTITSSGTVECSPSNTGADLTTKPDKGLYFRTPPPDNLQAQATAKVLSDDGRQNVAIVAQNTDYGTGYIKFLKPALEDAGIKVATEVTYDPNGTAFDSEIGKVQAAKPDAVALIGYPEDGGLILKGMFQQGLTPDKLPVYITDGMQDNALYKQIDAKDPSVTEGIKGTAAAAAPTNGASFFPDAFKKFAPDVESPIYSSQSYDCAALFALAAQKAKSNAPFDIAKEITNVSKGETADAETCSTIKDCFALLKDGKDINYDGASGTGDFTDYGEPSAGQYDVYEFQADGTYKNGEPIDISS
jgi:branched-chain amino acid transport system substrate-binding protein